LQKILNEEAKKYGLTFNIGKTKTLIFGGEEQQIEHRGGRKYHREYGSIRISRQQPYTLPG